MGPGIKKIGKVTAESVQKCTGKNWDEWIEILKLVRAEAWTHQEIVAYLKKKHKLSPWWQQGVTYGFEVHMGKRVEGRTLKGDYSTVATRTVNCSAHQLWKFLCSPAGVQMWLDPLSEVQIKPKSTYEVKGGIFGEIRTTLNGKRIRLTWQEEDWAKPSIVQVNVVARPNKKCVLAIQHENLGSAALKSMMLKRWKEAINRVAQYFSKS